MPKHTWIFASVLSTVVVVSFMALTIWNRGRALESLQEQLRAAQLATETNASGFATLKENLTESQTRIEALAREKEQATQAQRDLEQQMRGALESKDITISELQGRLTVTMLDRILFDSGEAVIKPEGEQVLRQIAAVLAQYPKRLIHVIGHTDNVPIRAGSRGRFATNWELSTARATAAVRFLQEQAGVDPARLAAVGHGEFHPVADNSTAEGRAKNRRIALVVLPEELTATEHPPSLPAEPARHSGEQTLPAPGLEKTQFSTNAPASESLEASAR